MSLSWRSQLPQPTGVTPRSLGVPLDATPQGVHSVGCPRPARWRSHPLGLQAGLSRRAEEGVAQGQEEKQKHMHARWWVACGRAGPPSRKTSTEKTSVQGARFHVATGPRAVFKAQRSAEGRAEGPGVLLAGWWRSVPLNGKQIQKVAHPQCPTAGVTSCQLVSKKSRHSKKRGRSSLTVLRQCPRGVFLPPLLVGPTPPTPTHPGQKKSLPRWPDGSVLHSRDELLCVRV